MIIGKATENWLELCEYVVKEQNPEKLTKLFAELHHILEEKNSAQGDRAVRRKECLDLRTQQLSNRVITPVKTL